jgi:hypothetical protein
MVELHSPGYRLIEPNRCTKGRVCRTKRLSFLIAAIEFESLLSHVRFGRAVLSSGHSARPTSSNSQGFAWNGAVKECRQHVKLLFVHDLQSSYSHDILDCLLEAPLSGCTHQADVPL